MSEQVSVMVIDDSVTYRQILVAVIEKISDAQCVGTAASGAIALRKIALLKPDLVLLDAVMPDMDGVATLQKIKQLYPAIEAIMISSFDMNNAKETLRSLQIGALDFVAKPKVSNPEDGIAELVKYLQPLVHLVQTKKYATFSRRDYRVKPSSEVMVSNPATIQTEISSAQSTAITLRLSRGKFDLIVMGVSTGGPKALDELIPKLDSALPCPILIVQHMPPMFTESLAMKLNDNTALTVSEAKDGEELSPAHIYIAPGGKHLLVRKHVAGHYCLALNDSPPVNNCRPSVDVLFRSVAATFQGKVLAVVMTGMGRDGTEGVRMLKHNGGKCIVQDQNSSIVWGMPGSVYEAGLADEVLPLTQLGNRINQLIL